MKTLNVKILNFACSCQTDLANIAVDIENRVKTQCSRSCCYSQHSIGVYDTKHAIKRLNHGKHDGHNAVYSDNFIHGSHRLHVLMALLLAKMITHNTVPSRFLQSMSIPIPKDKSKALTNSKNYRTIAMGSTLGKILDICLFNLHGNILDTNNLQFGFKRNHSASQCTSAVKEVIQYYNNKKSNIHVMLLDASQAFDRVSYAVLFRKLLDRGLCVVVCRILLHLYTYQIMYIKWSGCLSEHFCVMNGVKQGGVLSPTLFAVYLNCLFHLFVNKKVGCHIGHVYTGAFGYADDIILLAPSKSALNRMLDIANDYAVSHDIIFNASKCKYLVFGDNLSQAYSIKFNNVIISASTWEKHLGNHLDTSNSDRHISEAHSLVILQS